MAFVGQNSTILEKLRAVGLVPEETVSIDIRIAVNEVVTITTKSFASPEQIDAIYEAIIKHEDISPFTRDLYLSTYDGAKKVSVRL
jgi:hypothetical protein